jgi:Flp pilus assembly pilin Flp
VWRSEISELEKNMTRLTEKLHRVWVRLYRDRRGQDMIEYALMAAFVAVASAAVLPQATPSISTVISKVGSVLTMAGAG